jgi:hypothetical protein
MKREVSPSVGVGSVVIQTCGYVIRSSMAID